MIYIKNDHDISLMKKAGEIVRDTLNLIESLIKSGITTRYLDNKAEEFILKCKGKPSFKGYYGFPSTLCVSVNNEVIHGIPSDKLIKDGDIVSVDCGANIHGFHADAARTFGVGNITYESKKLINVTRDSFFEGVKYIRDGNRIGDVSNAIGRELHEAPEVPNFGKKGFGVVLKKGMAIAVEPMVNVGTEHVRVLDDNWTVITSDGSLSAHYENTVIVTEGEPEIITL